MVGRLRSSTDEARGRSTAPYRERMSELHVVATIPAKPESVDHVRRMMQTLAAATRQEQGCIAYDVYESAAAPGTFVTVERWRGHPDLDEHLASPHIAEAFAAADGKLAGEVQIHPLVPVD